MAFDHCNEALVSWLLKTLQCRIYKVGRYDAVPPSAPGIADGRWRAADYSKTLREILVSWARYSDVRDKAAW
jgi:hypothetical protein